MMITMMMMMMMMILTLLKTNDDDNDDDDYDDDSCQNKAGYTAIQSRTVGQERKPLVNQKCDVPTDRRTDRPTRQVLESRVRD